MSLNFFTRLSKPKLAQVCRRDVKERKWAADKCAEASSAQAELEHAGTMHGQKYRWMLVNAYNARLCV